MEVESRKRPHGGGEGDRVQTKKRVLSSANGSPRVNGTESEEHIESDNLELFRKEAIFRRMRHYSREHERGLAQIAELERRKAKCEAGLSAITACWAQLVEAIRLLVRVEDLPPVDIKTAEMFDMTAYVLSDSPPALKTALKENMDATQQLVRRFAQLSGSNHSPVSREEMYAKAQAAQTQCTSLQSQITVMRAQYNDSMVQRESLRTALHAAESRLDRFKSTTVQAIQGQTVVVKQDPEQEKREESQRRQPSSPAIPPAISSPQDLQLLEDLHDKLQAKHAEITDLERENADLRDQRNQLSVELKGPSLSVTAENPHYKSLLDYTSRLEYTANQNTEEVKRLREELDQLHCTRKEFEDDIIASNAQACQELKSLLAKRDAEILRLRDQRDQQSAEIAERKQKESVKITSFQELKALAESRSERINVLCSEITRLKTRLAALAGGEDLVTFLQSNQSGDSSYVKDLQTQLRNAQARISSLEQSLSALEDRHPEVEAHQQLDLVKKKLDAYQSTFGDLSVLPPDLQTLSEQLRRKEDEIQSLRKSEAQHAQAETSLCMEVDKLSAAWDALDHQVNSKVFNLMAMEDRLQKSAVEKTKTEHKFYAAMRDKDAIEAERKTLTRSLEKQAKAVERLVDSEKNLMVQVSDLEKEIVQWKKKSDMLEARAMDIERESVENKNQKASEEQRAEGYRTTLQEREKYLEKKRAEWRKTEEDLTRLKKEAERQAAKVQLLHTSLNSNKDAELEHEATRLMSLLKCSTCNMRMRNTVINKCMHTFCKECVETRISLRNRKCPYCNLAFAQSDVQFLFFQ